MLFCYLRKAKINKKNNKMQKNKREQNNKQIILKNYEIKVVTK